MHTCPYVTHTQKQKSTRHIHTMYAQRTNGIGASDTCDKLIQAEDAVALGDGALCTWDTDGQILRVLLGQGSTIGVGSSMFILAGIVRSQNGVSSSNLRRSGARTSVVVGPADVLVPPRFELRVVGLCVLCVCVCVCVL